MNALVLFTISYISSFGTLPNHITGFPGSGSVKKSTCNAGYTKYIGLILGQKDPVEESQYTVSETSQSQKDETMLCDSPHTRHLKQSNSLKTESRMVVARSWREEEMRAVV